MSERDEARRLLRELLGQVEANGHGHPPPQVPAPPVAAILRPSTWTRPPAPGEVIGDAPAATPPPPAPATSPPPPAPSSPAPATSSPPPATSAPASSPPPASPTDARVELVSLDSDAELDRFVRALLARFENPRDRMAIRAGKLRFALRRADTTRAGALRIERGAVTERTVKQAAEAGARLVLAPRAVLTPLARDRARALGVEIERER